MAVKRKQVERPKRYRKWKAKNTKMFHPVFVQFIYHTVFIVPIVCNSCNVLVIAVP
jgi:hypothetical protein